MRRHGITTSAAVLAAAATVLAGCGSSGGSAPDGGEATVTSTRTVTGEPTPTPSGTGTAGTPASPEPGPTTTVRDAASVVEDYYAAVNARDFRRAWDLGGKRLGGSYSAFVAGFADTVRDTVHIVGVSGDVVTVTLEAGQRDGSVRSFAGTYTVRDGGVVAADIRAVASPTPDDGGGSRGAYPPGPPAGVPDVDCSDLGGPVHVGPDDPHRLDRDHDGDGCEPDEE
ncbi:hypothetical protein A6A06_03265 [Streptomyces sp. CB02923]|uniref:hypothetical protein n=1 Tax=Streptomyces sp. CB02923 TaxID=1718985 RepID=UPI00093F444A|nr:hypothetical protein [Streptomyces sp. CB02923]OKI09695.1 hypothetical protein A6A06_03265 [Streptomyces sp. CB02923]